MLFSSPLLTGIWSLWGRLSCVETGRSRKGLGQGCRVGAVPLSCLFQPSKGNQHWFVTWGIILMEPPPTTAEASSFSSSLWTFSEQLGKIPCWLFDLGKPIHHKWALVSQKKEWPWPFLAICSSLPSWVWRKSHASLSTLTLAPVFPLTLWLIGKCPNFLQTIVPKAPKRRLCAQNFVPIQY